MRLAIWTHNDFFALGKAVFRKVTGLAYPFAARTTQRATLMVQSLFAANANLEMLRAVKSGSIEGLKGILLDRRVLESNTVREKPQAARISGRFRPIVSPAPVDIAISGDTIVMRRATATQSEIAFRTEAAALIPAGSTESNLVYAVALETGTRGNGIPAYTALALRNAVADVQDFYTETESAGGYSRELDPELRSRARNNQKGHGECTWAGIESLLKTVEITGAGARGVKHAKVFEAFEGGHGVTTPPSITGIVYAIIDDGTGQLSSIGPLDSTTYGFGTANYYTYVSSGNILYIQLPYGALDVWDDGVNAILERDDGAGWIAQAHETDYWVDSDRGLIALASPLTVGQSIRCQFSFYTGLIQECAKKLTGISGNAEYRGWRPVGSSIRVRAPFSVTNPSVSASLSFLSGWDSDFGRQTAVSAVSSYLNSLAPGESAVYLKVSGLLYKVKGIDTVKDLLLDGNSTDLAPTHPYGVIRGNGTIAF